MLTAIVVLVAAALLSLLWLAILSAPLLRAIGHLFGEWASACREGPELVRRPVRRPVPRPARRRRA